LRISTARRIFPILYSRPKDVLIKLGHPLGSHLLVIHGFRVSRGRSVQPFCKFTEIKPGGVRVGALEHELLHTASIGLRDWSERSM